MLTRAWLGIRSFLLRRRLEREMRDEMAEHLERSTQRLMARGLSRAVARSEAEREFGNLTYLQEEARFARGTAWLDALGADCRFALRHFVRKVGTTLTMLVVLTVGLAISTLLFSYVHAYAVRPPLGIEPAEGLVRIRGSQSAGADGRGVRLMPEEEFSAYRMLEEPFEQVAGWTDELVALDAGPDPDRRGLQAKATFVAGDYFSVLGVRPVLGPGLAAAGDDPVNGLVAVIGHSTWNHLFGGDAAVIGSPVVVNGVPVTIVGVAPERFSGIGGPAVLQLWMPLSARRAVLPDAPAAFRAVGRLRRGVTPREATAVVQVVAARAAVGAPRAIRELEPSADVVPLLSANGDPMFDRDVRLMTIALGLLATLVLLVTCTNVSALLTGLAMARRQEIAIRLSMGASRSRLIRQLLTESALLAVAAGAGALGLVWLVLRTVRAKAAFLPFEVGLTWPATVFTFGVAIGVGLLFGISPALHATRAALAGALKDSTTSIAAGRARLQRALVVAQIAFTQPLVVSLAAVLVFVLNEYGAQDRTAGADRIVSIYLHPNLDPGDRAQEDRHRQRTARLVDRLRGTPGVERAVVDGPDPTPLGAYHPHPDERAAGAAPVTVRIEADRTEEGYFAVMGIPLVRGRGFAARDIGTAEPAAIVDAELARRLWGGADPIGRRLLAASDTAAGPGSLVVIGVFDDSQARTRQAGRSHRVFLAADPAQVPYRLLVRTAGSAETHVSRLRAVIQQEAPGLAFRISTLEHLEEVRRSHFRTVTGGVSLAGLMALLLSAIGLYAVVAFAVGQRMREIAVRIAVGASARQIARRFVTDGLRLSAVGLLLGLPVSLLALRALLTLDEDMPQIPLASVAAIAALGVAAVATLAAWLPARRAARVDPAITLRSS